MRMKVRHDPSFLLDIDPPTRENRRMAAVYLRALLARLSAENGILNGSTRMSSGAVSEFVWEDSNWRLGYTLEERRRLLIFKTRIVTIRSFERK